MAKFNEQQIADLYSGAVAEEVGEEAEHSGVTVSRSNYDFDMTLAECGGTAHVIRSLIDQLREANRKLIAPLPIGELLQRLKDQAIGDEYVSLRDLQQSFECLPRYDLLIANNPARSTVCPAVCYEDVRKLLGSAAKPSDHLANAQRLARETAALSDRLNAPDALTAADRAGLIPWRSAKAELPTYLRENMYVPLCIVQIFYCPDAEANPFATEKAIVWDWYHLRSVNPHRPEGQAPGYWECHDGFVLNWCYATDLMKTVPEDL